jgi:hypothetical protein
VFGAKAGNDVIRDFDVVNDRLVFEGVSLRSSQQVDANGDGIADLRLSLSGGGTVTLLGVASLSEVQIEAAATSVNIGVVGDAGVGFHQQMLVDSWLA